MRPYVLLTLILAYVALCLALAPARAAEGQATGAPAPVADSATVKCTHKPLLTEVRGNPENLLTPVLFMHGTGGSGDGMQKSMRAAIEKSPLNDVLLLYPTFPVSSRFLLDGADTHVLAELARLKNRYKLADKLLLFGFSGGAQFVHRFALKHPESVQGCVCLAAGSWTNPAGVSYGLMVEEKWFDKAPWNTPAVTAALNAKASPGYQQLHWLIACGETDTPSRLNSAKRFYQDIKETVPSAEYVPYPGGHVLPPAKEMAVILTRMADWLRPPPK